jgi:hypothetical protein
MPYIPVLNSRQALSPSEAQDMAREFNLLRAELDDMRTKYTALLAKLDADVGVTDVNYAATGALTARQFTPT